MNTYKNKWKAGTIFDCMNDLDSCCATIFLPCIIYSENKKTLYGGAMAEKQDFFNNCCLYCLIMSLSACTLQCLYTFNTRTDIRRKYNLEESPCDDCLTHICCHFCALCQEHRELKAHGISLWPAPANEYSVNNQSMILPNYPFSHISPVPSNNFPTQIQMHSHPVQHHQLPQMAYPQNYRIPYAINQGIYFQPGYPDTVIQVAPQQYQNYMPQTQPYRNPIVRNMPNPSY